MMGADGGYDKRKVFNLLASPKQRAPIRPLIPPRHDAKIEQHGNRKAPPPSPAMKSSEPSGVKAADSGNAPVAIIVARSLKPNYAATNNALGGSCVREIRRTKKRKRGWDVRCSIA